jgi:hypothetical protein
MRSDSIAATPRGGVITRDGVIGVNESRRSAASALDEIDAPDDLRLEHLAVVAALDDLVAAVDRFLERTSALDDGAFATAVAEESGLEALAQTVGRACATLDGRISDLGYEADIRC